MIDAVREAYTALRLTPAPAPDRLDVLPVEGVERAFLAIDDLYRPHLLLVVESAATNPAAGVTALEVTSRNLVVEGVMTAFTDVTCLFESVAEVFDHFVASVLERLRDPLVGTEAALSHVLEKWRQFLVPAKNPIGRDRLSGIFGELLVLLDLADRHAAGAVSAWRGPFGGRHDFRSGTAAMEVKTTMSHSSRVVQIHGEDQLEPPDGGTLHLHFVRLEAVPQGGQTVPGVMDTLLARGVSAEPLFQALGAGGLPVAELSATIDVGFSVIERQTFEVGSALPRVVPASFVDGRKPVGVVDLTYSIDLDHALHAVLDEPAYSAAIDQIAGAA